MVPSSWPGTYENGCRKLEPNAVHSNRLSVGERLLRELHLKLRDAFLNGEIFYSMKEIRVLADAGASTTTPSGRTPRWGTNLQHRRRG